MAAPFVTFKDMIEHLRDALGGISLDANHSRMKSAVRDGYADLVARHTWKYFETEHAFYFNASFADGTITYTHSTRTVLFTDTLPTTMTAANARNWRIVIDGRAYAVDSKTDANNVVLSATVNPGANVAALTEFTLYQNTYDCPDQFGGAYGFLASNWLRSCYLTPAEWHTMESTYGGSTGPFYWTVMRSPVLPATYVVRTLGYPGEAMAVTLLYRRQAKRPVRSGFEAASYVGTVAVTAASATITGTTTSFDATMQGAVLRISTDASTVPTSPDGTNPAVEELLLKTYGTATSFTAQTLATQALSGKKYVVSDLLDVDQQMLNALKAACRWQWYLAANDSKLAESWFGHYMSALHLAMECEPKSQDPTVANPLYNDTTGWFYWPLEAI